MVILKRMIVKNRAKILAAAETPKIISGIILNGNGSLEISMCNWAEYWGPVSTSKDSGMSENLEKFYLAWKEYILSGCHQSFQRQYCYLYHALMNRALNSRESFLTSDQFHKAISKIVSFENFRIKTDFVRNTASAGGTTTLRNPNYLLARIKNPNAPDDPRLLPLISTNETRNELFHYYRQHRLSPDSGLSLLLYPVVTQAARPDSFGIINKLEACISSGTDPWAGKRAQTFIRGIYPFVERTMRDYGGGRMIIEFIDLGSGSGALLAHLCDELSKLLDSEGAKYCFRIWMIDIAPVSPVKEFAKLKRRGKLDSVTCLPTDYKEWLSRQEPLPPAGHLRIAVVSRFFNNLSDFTIRELSLAELPGLDGVSGQYKPHICLAYGGEGADALHATSSKLVLKEGNSFQQVSLSDYFKCLYLLQNSLRDATAIDPAKVFLPIRGFQMDSLITNNGESVLERLLEMCDAIALQDADLSPELLHSHIKTHCRTETDVIDLTDAIGLHRHHFYTITKAGNTGNRPGESL
jgi:hypothetical protein